MGQYAVDDVPDRDPRPTGLYKTAAPNLCDRDPVAFDLSAMTPVDPTPPGFASAWAYARQNAELPGFVVAFTGTMSGPVLEARVGAVYPVAVGIYSFMKVVPGGYPQDVTRNATDPFRVSVGGSRHEFITAFGSQYDRQGFVVSEVTVDGRLDGRCQTFRDVVVTLTLPASNIGQPFGGTTMEAALGAMTVDSNRDGTPDSWNVTLAAPSLSHLMFRL